MQRIETDAIRKFGRIFDIPDGKIRTFTGFDCAAVIKTKRPGCMECSPLQGFNRCHPEKRATHVHRQKHGGQGEEPGLQSVAKAIGTPCSRKASIGGALGFADGVVSPGQNDSDSSRCSHGGYTALFQYSTWSAESAP